MRRFSRPLVAAAAFLGGVLLAPSLPPATGVSPEAPVQPEGARPAEADVYYPGCDSVRAAGRAPLLDGEPGYREDMDGDLDGIACEPHRGGGP